MLGNMISIMAAGMLAATSSDATLPEQPSAAATAAAVAAQEKAEDKIVCKRITPTGTRLGGERVCKPKSYWDNVQRDAQRGVGQHQIRGMQANPGAGG